MERFIPVSQQAKEDLDERVRNTPFRSVEEFIALYNDDLINKKASLAKEILQELVSTYKDVEEKSRKIIFLDPAEVYLNESLRALAPWELIVKIKREIQSALDAGTLDSDPSSVLVFTPQATGILCKLVEKEDGSRSFVKIGVEKLFTNPEAIEEIFRKYSTTGEGKDGTYSFKVEDFTSLDDSFIFEIRRLIPEV